MPASRLRVRCSVGNEVSVPQPARLQPAELGSVRASRHILTACCTMPYNFDAVLAGCTEAVQLAHFPGPWIRRQLPVRAGVTAAPVLVLACPARQAKRGLDGGPDDARSRADYYS